jgi:hypothetical protein
MRTFATIVVLVACCLNNQAGDRLLLDRDDNSPANIICEQPQPWAYPFLRAVDVRQWPAAPGASPLMLVLELTRSESSEYVSGKSLPSGALLCRTLQSLDVRLQV